MYSKLLEDSIQHYSPFTSNLFADGTEKNVLKPSAQSCFILVFHLSLCSCLLTGITGVVSLILFCFPSFILFLIFFPTHFLPVSGCGKACTMWFASVLAATFPSDQKRSEGRVQELEVFAKVPTFLLCCAIIVLAKDMCITNRHDCEKR